MGHTTQPARRLFAAATLALAAALAAPPTSSLPWAALRDGIGLRQRLPEWWCQFYIAIERGRLGYEKNHHDFAKLIWTTASPQWQFDDATYERSAASKLPNISMPTITMEGDANGTPHPNPAEYAKKFTGKYHHIQLTGGIGHNLPQEAPKAFANAILEVGKL